MNSKKAKKIRQELRMQGIPISAEPYSSIGKTIVASKGRKIYQARKRTDQ